MELVNSKTRLAYGTGTAWFVGPGANTKEDHTLNQQLIDSLKLAMKVGYRHLDCAEIYGTEREVGQALSQFLAENPSLSRNDFYITSKVWSGLKDIAGSLKHILSRLNLTHLDLFLIHAPFFSKVGYNASLSEAWTIMESLVDQGLTRHIGVSNYRIEDIKAFLPGTRIKPLVNQIEYNPYLQQPELIAYCKDHGIGIEAYSGLCPLHYKTDGPVNTVIEAIALKYKRTPAQVLIQWALEKGFVSINTSNQLERLREFWDLEKGEFHLTHEEVEEINKAGSSVHFRKYWAEEHK